MWSPELLKDSCSALTGVLLITPIRQDSPEEWPPTGTRPQVLECTPCRSVAGLSACELGKPLIMLVTGRPGEEKRLLGGWGLPQAWGLSSSHTIGDVLLIWMPTREREHQPGLAEASTEALTWEVLRERRGHWMGCRG